MKNVSIVIPSVRWEPLTEQCVRVCKALYPESPVFLVLDVVDIVHAEVEGVVVLYGQTGTIAQKRNKAVKLVQTEYVAFIDSDAFPKEKWLENAVECLMYDSTVGFVGGPNISPPTQKGYRNNVGMATQSWLVTGKWAFYKTANSSARYCDNLPSCNWVFRKSVFSQLNGMNEHLAVGEDTDYCARLLSASYLIYFHPEVIVFHYDRDVVNYLLQRIVRGAGTYELLAGSSAQQKSVYTYVLLLPLFVVLFWFSAIVGLWYKPWLYVVALAAVMYLLLIGQQAIKHSCKTKDIPMVFLLISAGNLLPGIGIFLQLTHLLPSIKTFYRNDK